MIFISEKGAMCKDRCNFRPRHDNARGQTLNKKHLDDLSKKMTTSVERIDQAVQQQSQQMQQLQERMEERQEMMMQQLMDLSARGSQPQHRLGLRGSEHRMAPVMPDSVTEAQV